MVRLVPTVISCGAPAPTLVRPRSMLAATFSILAFVTAPSVIIAVAIAFVVIVVPSAPAEVVTGPVSAGNRPAASVPVTSAPKGQSRRHSARPR